MTEFMDKLSSQILDFSERNPRTVEHVNTSKKLARLIEKFHKTSKTLQNALQETITKFAEEETIVLEAAHQPNFLPYSGIFKKVILLEHIARNLEKKGHSVVCLFSIVDTDFADDEWFASNRFPHLSKNGYLKVGLKIANKDRKKCMYAIQKPSHETWETIIESINAHYGMYLKELEREFSKQNISNFEQNIEIPFQKKWDDLLDLLEESYQKADNFADMNAIFLSKVINDLMQCSITFFKYSDGLNAFEEPFSRLLSCNTEYIQLYNRYAEQYNLDKIYGVYAPFWYHCTECEGKVPLQQRETTLEGTCLVCKEQYVLDFENQDAPDLSRIIEQISPRAIPRHYITFDGLGVSFYAGGQAGSTYTSIAEKIAQILRFRFPLMVTWFNKDHYTGILQFHAFLQIHNTLELDSYDQFLPRYTELKAQIGQKVDEIQNEIQKLDIEQDMLKNRLLESENEEIRNKIISELRSISATERELMAKIQQSENDISIIDNAVASFRIFPSILDYLNNIDALSLTKQWSRFLTVIEPIDGSTQLETHFSDFLHSKFSWLIDIENCIESITQPTPCTTV